MGSTTEAAPDDEALDPSPSDDDDGQIAERLAWSPRERLQYLLDVLAFEDRARHARRLTPER